MPNVTGFWADLLGPDEPIDGYVEPIALAFEDYIVMHRAFGHCPGPRIEWIRRMLRGGYAAKRSIGIPIPVVRHDNVPIGAANIYLPDASPDDQAKLWWPLFLEEAGPKTSTFFEKFFEFTESVELPPHLLVGMIGVLPEHQGKGAGGVLLKFLIGMAEAHPTAQGVGLDTEVESNVGLYQKFGFEVMGNGEVDGMPVWVMFRPND